ncbi:MAG TPA: cupin domain-containing protein [Bacteroidales bacterium]|jgi:quercetin dioxygenase-like cupin family protein|nr:cupin domain-containing protein [Bacteroidales bacterium]
MDTIETAKTFSFNEIVHYEDNGIVSKQIIKKSTGNVTLFAFAAGQMLSEHSAPFDALVQVIEGSAEIVIGGIANTVKAGESIIMPANIPHGVNAHEKFKMLLTMIRSQE